MELSETVTASAGNLGETLVVETASPREVAEVAGRYLVLEKLGEGGMGVVHRAYDPALRREVALKVLRVAGSKNARVRLLREAQALAKVTHPNVVTIYDVGASGDDVFLAMELVRGKTLDAWLRDEHRTPGAILATFAAAGRGLAAAHTAGLVHRDFKPANVMVGDDGRVRVLDFGLARIAGDVAGPEPTSPVESPDHLNSPITKHGAVVGTPRYMSPEQRGGSSADERSDQYAFCFALNEALGNEINRVGRRARAAIARGLSSDPAKRFSSMDDMLAELTPRRRRVYGAVAAVIAAGTIGAAMFLSTSTPAADPPCSAIAVPFETMWNAQQRQRIHDGFVASKAPIAEATWARIVPLVDRWGASWVEARREACAATQLRGEQSATLMDLRMGCLDDRRRELASLLDVFANADSNVVTVSIRAMSHLEPIAHCNDTAALANVPPPKPAVAAAVGSHKVEVAAISAAVRVVKVGGTVARAEKAVNAAVALGYAPLEARARFELGVAQNEAGQYAAAFATLEAAALAADRGGDDWMRARAWTEVVFVAGSPLRKGDDALRARSHAIAAIDRLRDPGSLPLSLGNYTAATYGNLGKHEEGLAEIDAALKLVTPSSDRILIGNLYNQQGLLFDGAGRQQDALDAYAKARTLYEAEFGTDHPRIAALLSNSANALSRLAVPDDKAAWKFEESERMQREALAIGERSLGPDHPQVATYLNNIVNLFLLSERFADALPFARRAVDIRERKLPPDHPLTVRAVINLATIIQGMGKPDEAEPMFVRGLAMQTRSLPAGHYDIAYARLLHGINLLDMGRGADARAELTRSYDLFSKLQAPDSNDATLVMAWLARGLVDAGDAKSGLARAEQAIALAVKHGDLYIKGIARLHRARAMVALGRRVDGITEAKSAIAELAKQSSGDSALVRAKIEKWLASLGT